MSHSYRKPYGTFVGVRSSEYDKRTARRAVRRQENFVIRSCQDWEEIMLPDKYECFGNDVWGWSRDGKPRLHFPPEYPYLWLFLFGEKDADEYYEHSVRYYQDLKRK